MDTCIAIRTMTFKNGTAYLQAGGGIVFDSMEEDEYIETVNKLGANVRALAEAERESNDVFGWLHVLRSRSEYWFDVQAEQTRFR